MAISIIPDLVAPHEYEEDDKSGMLARGFRVDGLTSDTDISQKALEAQDNGISIPSAGQPHPKLADLVVRRVNVRPVSGSRTGIRIAIYYVKVRRRLLDVVYNGVSINTTTNRNRDAALMIVGYKPPQSSRTGRDTTPVGAGTPFPSPPVEKNGWDYNYAVAPYLLPETTLEITYLENESPDAKAKLYARKLNAKDWQGGKPREWLCESITGHVESPIPTNLADLKDQKVVTGKARFNWLTTYRFRKRPLPPDGPGWDPLLLFVDTKTGRTPNDVDPLKGEYLKGKILGNGWLVDKLYFEADFDKMDLVSAIEGKA
jgi:hypothetical protein